tara:strand:+ start:196 stop:435 length:240 start_codon:yes stop_codon:yes gene_type:complete
MAFKMKGWSAFKQSEDDDKDFSDESKYKTVREGRTGGVVQDIDSGKFYSKTFGHEMDSTHIRNPFDPSIVDVKWHKKNK